MATLLEALSEGSYDLQNKRDISSDFARKVTTYRDSVVNDYLKYGSDLNQLIAKLILKDALTDEQTKRIIEEVNNQIYLVLYNRMKQDQEREVKFDLASFPKVKEIVQNGGKVSVIKPEKNASDNIGSFEKIASEHSDIDEKLDIFNSPCREFEKLTADQDISWYKFTARNIAEKHASLKEKLSKTASSIIDNACTVADALIQYDKIGEPADEIFGELVKKANLTPSHQKFIKVAMEQVIDGYKENKTLANIYSLDIKYKNPNAIDEFSLGKNSLIKEASEKYPAIIANNITINNLDDLSKIASLISEEESNLKDTQNQIDKIETAANKSGFTIEDINKVAADGGMIKNFLHNLSGKSVRNAEGILNDSKKKVEELGLHPDLQAVEKYRNELTNRRNTFTNPFIEGAKQKKSDMEKEVASHWNSGNIRGAKKVNKHINKIDQEIGKATREGQGEIDKTLHSYDKEHNRISNNIGLNKAKQDVENNTKELNSAQKSHTRAKQITGAGLGVGGLATYNVIKNKKNQENQMM